jgi:membrane protein
MTDRLAYRPLQHRLIANYRAHDGDGLATIIAYNALFSLTPLLLLLVTAISLLDNNLATHQQLERWLESALPATTADQVLSMVDRGSEQLSHVGILTLVGLVVGGSRLFGALDRTFATIYDVPRRSFVTRKLVALVMVPIVTLLVLVAAVASTLATLMIAVPGRVFESEHPRWVSGFLALLVAYCVAYGMAWLAYATVPTRHARGLAAWPGAVTAAGLVVLLNQLFPLYIRMTGGFGLYGSAFVLILVLMVWLYLIGQIIVVGAEVNVLIADRRHAIEQRTRNSIQV